MYIVFYKGMYPQKGSRRSYSDEALYIYGDKLKEEFPNKAAFQKEIEEEYGLRWVHIINILEVTQEQAKKYYS